MGVAGKLRSFDAYPKTLDDFKIRTLSGAAVSIVSTCIIILLVISEFRFYLAIEKEHNLFVDTSRGEKLRITLDLTFPHMSCSVLSLDTMDISGATQTDVVHTIYKRRIGKDGEPLSEEQDTDFGGKNKADALDQQAKREGTDDSADAPSVPDNSYCGSCYGAEEKPGDCCNNCDDVREAYRKKGWAFAHGEQVEQCSKEGLMEVLEEQQGEGCNVYGFLEVNKVAGNFHFAPGKSFQQSSAHVHDLMSLGHSRFNTSHTVNKLAFGDYYPGATNPLDAVTRAAADVGIFQYFVKVVPTIYEYVDGSTTKTNQFSVTEHFKPVNEFDSGIPGVFVFYDLSPIMVKIAEKRKSFPHFLTGVCAIVGGVFTVSGIIDSIIYNTHRYTHKIELGKHN